MKKEFKWTLHCLKVHLQVEKSNRRDHKALLRLLAKQQLYKPNYKRRLLRALRNNENKVIELTRAIKILSR